MAEQAGRQGAGRKGSDPGGEPIAAGGKSVKATPGWLLAGLRARDTLPNSPDLRQL